jgi:hypothetical protein
MRWACLLLLLSLAGCDDDVGGGAADLGLSADLAMIDQALNSQCGLPGDVGDDAGIGRFCTKDTDCMGGTFCVHDVAPSLYFCSILCNPDGGAVCGDNRCDCANHATPVVCGCFPTKCP